MSPTPDGLAQDLVSQCQRCASPGHRMRITGDEHRAGLELAPVAAAETATADLQDHLARRRLARIGDLLHTDIATPVPARRAH